MKNKLKCLALVCVCASCLVSCTSHTDKPPNGSQAVVTSPNSTATNPNEAANKIFVGAASRIEDLKSKTNSYSETHELLSGAIQHFDSIISQFPTSDIAVRLVSGESKVAGLTLNELRKFNDSLIDSAAAERDYFPCAVFVAREIKEPLQKISSLSALAEGFIAIGDTKQAALMLSEASQVARSPEVYDVQRAVAIAAVGKGYALIGMKAEAEQTLSSAVAAIVEPDTENSYDQYMAEYRCEGFAAIASGFVSMGKKKESQEALSKARDVLRHYSDKSGKKIPFVIQKMQNAIAGVYAMQGDISEAVKLLQATPNPIETSILVDFAEAYAKAGKLTEANRTADEVGEQGLGDKKSLALITIAEVYADAGNKEAASNAQDEAILWVVNHYNPAFDDVKNTMVRTLVNISVSKTKPTLNAKFKSEILRDIVGRTHPLELSFVK